MLGRYVSRVPAPLPFLARCRPLCRCQLPSLNRGYEIHELILTSTNARYFSGQETLKQILEVDRRQLASNHYFSFPPLQRN